MFREIVAFRRSPQFNDRFRYDLRQLLRWRRDVRRFRTDAISEALVEELLDLAFVDPGSDEVLAGRIAIGFEQDRPVQPDGEEQVARRSGIGVRARSRSAPTCRRSLPNVCRCRPIPPHGPPS